MATDVSHHRRSSRQIPPECRLTAERSTEDTARAVSASRSCTRLIQPRSVPTRPKPNWPLVFHVRASRLRGATRLFRLGVRAAHSGGFDFGGRSIAPCKLLDD